LRTAVAQKGKDSVWAVVGDGWLAVADKRLKYEIETFNNAASRQVYDLVEQVLGIEKILDSVSWQAVGSAWIHHRSRAVSHGVTRRCPAV